jgi:hypothetical protein
MTVLLLTAGAHAVGAILVALLVALLVGIIVAWGARAIGVPDPIGPIVGLLLAIVIFVALY